MYVTLGINYYKKAVKRSPTSNMNTIMVIIETGDLRSTTSRVPQPVRHAPKRWARGLGVILDFRS